MLGPSWFQVASGWAQAGPKLACVVSIGRAEVGTGSHGLDLVAGWVCDGPHGICYALAFWVDDLCWALPRPNPKIPLYHSLPFWLRSQPLGQVGFSWLVLVP